MPRLDWDTKRDACDQKSVLLHTPPLIQTVEAVNENVRQRQLSMDHLLSSSESEWRNRLICGDKKYVLPSLLGDVAGQVNLIYIDPPFNTGADFSFPVRIDGTELEKKPSIIKQKAYRDTWDRGLDSYLAWLHETVLLLRELLAEAGSIYLHLDWRVVHYAKVIMDEIFSPECFRNEIIWKRDVAGKGAKRVSGQWPRNADQILLYSKNPTKWTFRQQYKSLSEEQKRAYRYFDADGRRFKAVQLGDYSAASIRTMQAEGLIYESATGQRYKKYFLDEAQDTIDCIWTDILGFGTRTAASERTGFPTQKPEALLERIINASSNPGDIVFDCFAGSGTTAAVAEKLGRRWITCDLSRLAVHTTRKRLLDIPSVRPFLVQNLGRYERRIKETIELSERTRVKQRTLGIDATTAGRSVTLTLTNFIIPPGDAPKEIRQAVKSWEQWIDYWAVDWDNKGDTFHNQWQDYRTRKKRTLQRSISHTYDAPGAYTVVVKVIDILGNDTTEALKIEVKNDIP